MRMINEAKEGLEDTLRNNYAIREEERVRMAEETIILLSDDNSDSETSEISSEPTASSNKASTLQAEHNSDNEETPLKNPCRTMDINKRSFRNNQKVTFEVWQ